MVHDSVDCCGRSEGEDGRHNAQPRGRTCVQRTDLGPWDSQKCVREICNIVSADDLVLQITRRKSLVTTSVVCRMPRGLERIDLL